MPVMAAVRQFVIAAIRS